MRNTMEIEGYRAVIQFDPDIDLFRGEQWHLLWDQGSWSEDASGVSQE